MKKLLIIVIVITLPLIAFFQYKEYKRFHPPVDYEYTLSDNIDLNYHDQTLVDEYYAKALEIGFFARMQWRNEIDVRFPDIGNLEEVNSAKYYNRLLARTTQLENVLTNSLRLKTDGYTNDEIKQIESGVSPEMIKWTDNLEDILSISLGDLSQHVWNVQKELIAKGYEHRLDGLFGVETQSAIFSFQTDHDIFPTGLMNQETFDALFLTP